MFKLVETKRHTSKQMNLPGDKDKLQVQGMCFLHGNEELLLADKKNKCVKQFDIIADKVRSLYSSDWEVFSVRAFTQHDRDLLAVLEGEPGDVGIDGEYLFSVQIV